MAGHSHYLKLGDSSRVPKTPPWLKRLPSQTKIVAHQLLFSDNLIGIHDAGRDAREPALS